MVGDAEALKAAVAEHGPDLVLTDIRMPPGYTDEGLRAAVELRRARPELAVVALSQYVQHSYAADLLDSADGRGVGYLLKDRVADVEEFITRCAGWLAAARVVDPQVDQPARPAAARPAVRLSAREREVLALIAEGHSNAAIARRLVVSEAAVGKHVGNIFAKLGLAPVTATIVASSPCCATSAPDERGTTMTFMSTTGQSPVSAAGPSGPPRMTPGRWVALAVAVPVALALIGWTGFSLVASVAQGSYPFSYTLPVHDGQLALNVTAGDITMREASGQQHRAADWNRPVRPRAPGDQRVHDAHQQQRHPGLPGQLQR